jgi:hypothetical protein
MVNAGLHWIPPSLDVDYLSRSKGVMREAMVKVWAE